MSDTIFQNTTNIYFLNSEDIYWIRNIPTVTTDPITDDLGTSVIGHGTLTDTGGENSIRRGFCYKAGYTGDPTILDHVVYDDGDFGTGAYLKLIADLIEGGEYQVRAYTINSAGVGYGSTIYFVTSTVFAETIVFTDYFEATLITDVAKLFRDLVIPDFLPCLQRVPLP
jgi:hypothetical protein